VNYECPRIEDAAGYVLRALPDSESESYRHHVTECGECAEKVAELGFVSHALLSAAPQLSAPPEISRRVMSVVRAESELLQAAGASADRPVRQERRGWRGFGLGRLGPLTAGALATVLVALGLGVGTLVSGDSGTSCTKRPATVDQTASPGGTAELELCDGSSTLALSGMRPPPEGRIYELWRDDPNDRQGPKPAGLFSVQKGRASVAVKGLRPGELVLVTHERPGGADVPTSMTPIVKVAT
jgi:hypothetical protein